MPWKHWVMLGTLWCWVQLSLCGCCMCRLCIVLLTWVTSFLCVSSRGLFWSSCACCDFGAGTERHNSCFSAAFCICPLPSWATAHSFCLCCSVVKWSFSHTFVSSHPEQASRFFQMCLGIKLSKSSSSAPFLMNNLIFNLCVPFPILIEIVNRNLDILPTLCLDVLPAKQETVSHVNSSYHIMLGAQTQGNCVLCYPALWKGNWPWCSFHQGVLTSLPTFLPTFFPRKLRILYCSLFFF